MTLFIFGLYALANAIVGNQGIVMAGDRPPARCNGSTVEIMECLKRETTNADNELNRIYNSTIAEVKDPKQVNLLRESQRLWLAHMNKELDFANAYYSEGTYGGIRVANLKIKFLENRTKDLKELVRP